MLETEIIKLREAIEALTVALGAVQPSAVAVPSVGADSPDTPSEPTNEPADEEPTINFQDVKDLTLSKSRDGHKDAIRTKLTELGVKKIQDIKKEDLPAYHDWLNTL